MRMAAKDQMKLKTATGEAANSSGDIKLDAWGEWPAGQVSDEGNDIWISGDSSTQSRRVPGSKHT